MENIVMRERVLGGLRSVRHRVEGQIVKWVLQEPKGAEVKEGEPRLPHLVLIEAPQVLGENVPGTLSTLLDAQKEYIFQALEKGFALRGCQVTRLNNKDSEAPVLNSPFAVLINPVYLGRLTEEAEAVLGEARDDEFEWDESYKRKREVLQKTLPETEPFAFHIGGAVCKRMKIEPRVHQNFINLVFIDDSQGHIRRLPYQWKRLLSWLLMAKLGSFKTLIVPYQTEHNVPIASETMFATLEGGHPTLPIGRLADALLPFGQAKKVGDWKTREARIAEGVWQNLPTVKDLIRLGQFLGERKLLSPPVNMSDLVWDKRRARKVAAYASFSRQAEGAFMAWDQRLKQFIMTVSGRFGAVKTNLTEHDLLAVVPSSREKGVVWVSALEGAKLAVGPSVEAEEFTGPLVELVREDPDRYGVWIKELSSGYIIDKKRGELAPAIRAVIHLHRWVETENLPHAVILVETDMERFPAVGCGVDKMYEMSADAMRRAIDKWNAIARKAKMAIFYVPNHGCNLFLFNAEDEQGVIPEDPTELFRKLVAMGALRFTYEVPQNGPRLTVAA